MTVFYLTPGEVPEDLDSPDTDSGSDDDSEKNTSDGKTAFSFPSGRTLATFPQSNTRLLFLKRRVENKQFRL